MIEPRAMAEYDAIGARYSEAKQAPWRVHHEAYTNYYWRPDTHRRPRRASGSPSGNACAALHASR